MVNKGEAFILHAASLDWITTYKVLLTLFSLPLIRRRKMGEGREGGEGREETGKGVGEEEEMTGWRDSKRV